MHRHNSRKLLLCIEPALPRSTRALLPTACPLSPPSCAAASTPSWWRTRSWAVPAPSTRQSASSRPPGTTTVGGRLCAHTGGSRGLGSHWQRAAPRLRPAPQAPLNPTSIPTTHTHTHHTPTTPQPCLSRRAGVHHPEPHQVLPAQRRPRHHPHPGCARVPHKGGGRYACLASQQTRGCTPPRLGLLLFAHSRSG